MYRSFWRLPHRHSATAAQTRPATTTIVTRDGRGPTHTSTDSIQGAHRDGKANAARCQREREREREARKQLLSRQIYRQTDAHAHRSTRGACGVRVSLYTRDLAAVVCRQAGLLGNVGLTVAAARHLRQPRSRVTSANVQRAIPSLTRRASISRPLQEQLRRLSDISRRRHR